MFIRLFDILFGCPCRDYSFPITAKKGQQKEAARATGTYVVCLECGNEFPYDWRLMKILTPKQVAARMLPIPVLMESAEPLVTKAVH